MKRKDWVWMTALLALHSFLATVFPQPNPPASQGPPGIEERERLKCIEQMGRIHSGILEFYREHKHLPDFLSDLTPKYCRPQDFICPAKARVGDQAWARARLVHEAMHDPILNSTTYSYEFNAKLWSTSDVTFRQYKLAQRDYLGLRFGKGDDIPIVRCFLHDRQKVLNISYGGQFYETGKEWEEKFGDEDFVHRELVPRAVLPPQAKPLENGVPRRPPDLGPERIDLTIHYNALLDSSWFQFPPTAQAPFTGLLEQPAFLSPVNFDARGVIQLKGQHLYRRFPTNSSVIQIGQLAKKLHFLLGAYGRAEIGQKIGEIRLNFLDEPPLRFDITYGVHLLDWRDDPAQTPLPGVKEKLAWWAEELAHGKKEAARLYDFQIVNPHPDREIASVELEVSVVNSIVSKSAPALFAITIEPSQ